MHLQRTSSEGLTEDKRINMAYKATYRFARISARKVRPLADLVRGKYADDALDILKYMPHRGARLLEKVIKSALGNAEDQARSESQQLDCEGLPHRRRTDVQAYPADVARHGVCDPQADGAHFRRIGISRAI